MEPKNWAIIASKFKDKSTRQCQRRLDLFLLGVKVSCRESPLSSDAIFKQKNLRYFPENFTLHWEIFGSILTRMPSIRAPTVKKTTTLTNWKEKKYCFDHAFGPESTNKEYVHGLSATAFAYGSTGRYAVIGKTYTMVGTRSDPGLMVLSLNTIFDMIKSDKSSDEFDMTCSYL